MTENTKLRCVTCIKEYPKGDAGIYSTLARFEDWCICRECVDAYNEGGPSNYRKVQAEAQS